MRLRDYLSPDLVLTDLSATDMESALGAIADKLADAGAVADRDQAFTGLLSREAAHTTVLGQGLALPHTTLPGLADPILLLALAREPVPFGPPEADPVQAFFALLSPPGREGEHIKLLARICRLVRHDGFMESLLAAEGAADALAYIRSVDEQHV
jgi:mannitol/fructose-specific phosphotransferase system IIA component (Ntr-type)